MLMGRLPNEIDREGSKMLFRKLLRRRTPDQGNRFLEPSDMPCERNDLLKTEANTENRLRELLLLAYRVKDGGPTLDVAPANRKWMNDTSSGFANRCLPLRIANQAGWFLLNHQRVEVIWDGRTSVHGLTITHGTLDGLHLASHFGHGILTWKIPYLFRTPPEYNLYVRGPANWCKDGACPLDAIVETDWTVSTFTMNWKITRVGVPIRFEKDEPICMIFPISRGEVERFQPEIRRLSDDKELEVEFKEWKASREAFNRQIQEPTSVRTWQKHYFVGKTITGNVFDRHQVKLKVRKFKVPD
jgi:hypothetical protein